MADTDHVRIALMEAFVDLNCDDIDAWSNASVFIGEAAMNGFADWSLLPRLLEFLESEDVNW